MSTQVDLFTNVEPTSVSPAIAKPFVSRSTFYQGDCLVEMDKIADKSVDMILCDLPYGMTSNKWDCEIELSILWQQYDRVLKTNGIIALTAGQPFTSKLVSSNFEMFRNEWIWNKDRGSNFANTVREPMKEHESILIFSKGKWTYNKQMEERKGSGLARAKQKFHWKPNSENYRLMEEKKADSIPDLRVPSSVQFFNCERGLHPTQKPTALMEYLIKTYTNEGETVLDNCMGSGTTGVACKKTGRHFIGIEKDPKYFEIAVSRVSAYCG